MKRSPLPRRTSPLKRSRKPIARSRITPKPRTASEFARIYGSKARVAWVKSLPCSVPRCGQSPCDNAHAETGGMGRKGDYETVAPLCRAHHRAMHRDGSIEYWAEGVLVFFAKRHLAHAAAFTAYAWHARVHAIHAKAGALRSLAVPPSPVTATPLTQEDGQ